MRKVRGVGAGVAALALLFVVLSGPAMADSNWGRQGRRGGDAQTASFNVGGLSADLQSRIMERLGGEPALQAAGVAINLAGDVIQLVGQITTEVLSLVKSILASLGVAFPISVSPPGGGATTTTTTARPATTTTTTTPPNGGGGGSSGGNGTGGDLGGVLPGFQDNLLSLIRQFVDRVMSLIQQFLPV